MTDGIELVENHDAQQVKPNPLVEPAVVGLVGVWETFVTILVGTELNTWT